MKNIARKYLGINSEKVEKIIESSKEAEEALLRAEMYAYFFINKKTALEMGREMREFMKEFQI